ncbi:Hypothetical predicted protein [Xyrichtys novacula]|uniref:Uncharacterized protein n=1 Tax=Xyrichtys novacula TaxID=13765 RepID=A0AAV1HHH2_XYRNO|nr:Hypothetical predicted protein [Xyrichtys novacula]
MSGQTGSTEWCEERDGTYCALYHKPLREREEVGYGIGEDGWVVVGWGGYVTPRAVQPLLSPVTPSTVTFSSSLSSLHTHTLPRSPLPPVSPTLCMPFRAF